MSLLKIRLIALTLCVVSALSISCASKPVPVPEGQVATVQRGNLSTDITGVGNLALSQKVDLAFEMDGTVQEVLVKEAESVKEGQVLARLDASAWEEQVTALEDKVTAAERNVTSKERAVISAERQVTDKKRALLQAQINVRNAELTLEQAKEPLSGSGRDASVTVLDPLDIEIKELQVELAKGKLEDAQTAIDDAEQAIEDAKVAVADAQKALADAQKALEDGQNASPEVKAPFSGFITSVNVAGGDEVKKGTVAVTIADPTKFEAEVMVSEVNILKVTLGGAASVLVEAMPGVTLTATVTQIAPSATIQSGVVNYKVKVELASLQPVTPSGQPGTAATGNVTAGAPSGRSGQASVSGNLTQEQINQMRQQRQASGSGQSGGQRSPASGTPTENAQLAEGMTVTVSIVTAEKDNVLLVPVQAIISRGGETLVQVLKDGVTEERPVQAGISNWQYAEITSGLSEGEQVIVPQGTTTTPVTRTPQQQQQQQRGQQGGLVPGIGRILR